MSFSDIEKEALDQSAKILEEIDMKESIEMLLQSFPGSFINKHNEFIAEPCTNQYFLLADCKTPLDIECKVLEWLSRAAFKTAPCRSDMRNRAFHESMLNGINDFLETDFSEQDMELIYQALGNAVDHERTIRFIESGYDLHILQKE